jgi:predicted nucleic acid-binding protein
MKVYLDARCLNRLTDDQTQPRVRQEAEAVEQVLKRMRGGSVQWVSSEVLADEIDRNPNMERKSENAALLQLASEVVDVNDGIARRASDLQGVGYGAFDALHLACAEAAGVHVLLTTDDGFIRKASRGDGSPRVAVRNPLSWSQEGLP